MKTFTKEQNKVLSEIYRRLNYFHGGDVTEKLFLLALPSTAKKIKQFNFIEPVSGETPRIYSWYRLTKRGQDFFCNYITKDKLTEEENHQLFTEQYVKTFNIALLDLI